MLNTANLRYAADSWNYLDPDQQQLRLPNSPLLRSALAGGAGFVVYGGWAVYANIEHGTTIGIRSGLVQGTYSLVLTFIMTLVTEWLFAMLAGLRLGRSIVIVVVCLMLFVTAYGIHVVVGTPEILMTIVPGFIVGSVYTTIYVWGLQRGTKSAFSGR